MRHPGSVTKYHWESWLGRRADMVVVPILGRSPVVVAAPLKEGAEAMDTALKATGYEDPTDWIGSYNKRTIAGMDVWSTHSYGIAIDLDYGGDNPDSPEHPPPDRNPHIYRPITLNDQMWGRGWQINREQVLAVEAIRTNNGKPVWRWLGWAIGDTMHFQVTCTPDDLATGIDPRTVADGEEDMHTLKLGDTGNLVSFYQSALKRYQERYGHTEPALTSGVFDAEMEKQVKKYESSAGVTQLGVIDGALAPVLARYHKDFVHTAPGSGSHVDEVARTLATRANYRLDNV